MRPYEKLAQAIIVRAADDYREALRELNKPVDVNKRLPRLERDKRRAAEAMVRDVEKFFLSRWYGQLTLLDGENLLNELRKEVASEG